MKKVMLDTNAYAGLMGGDADVLEIIARAEIVLVSIIVLGELSFGFKNGSREKKNQEILNHFLAKPSVRIAVLTPESADIFAEIKLQLKQQGTPIPTNDIWIASLAKETGARLMTYDNHFKRIPGLLLWNRPE